MNRKKIGSISVDSGTLLLTDPCYIKEELAVEQYPQPGEAKTLTFSHANSLIFDTEIGDGWFDVYENRDTEGNLVSVEIQILSEE